LHVAHTHEIPKRTISSRGNRPEQTVQLAIAVVVAWEAGVAGIDGGFVGEEGAAASGMGGR